MIRRIPPELRAALDESGLPWRIENGGKHLKIFVADRLTAVLPKSGRRLDGSLRAGRNAVANVRRRATEVRANGSGA